MSIISSDRQPGALLDIDGTLLDTNWLHTLAWWRAFRRHGLTFPMSAIHPLIGMGADQLVPHLAGIEVDGVADAHAEEFGELRVEAVCLPGAQALVNTLVGEGIRVVLASSGSEEDVAHYREVLDVDDLLAGATTSADVDRSKPDNQLFEAAIEQFDLDRTRTVVVGDTVWDMEAAQRASLPAIAVATGGWTPQELWDAGAHETHADAAFLAEAITEQRWLGATWI